METDQIVAAILAAAQTAADGHNRADSYISNYRLMLSKLREPAPEAAPPSVQTRVEPNHEAP